MKYFTSCFFLFLFALALTYSQSGPPPYSAWNLTFEEDFEGSGLDTSKWDFGFGWDTNSTAFLETNRPENLYLENGNLIIRVDTIPGEEEGWYSAAINTKNHFSQHKGYFEVRMKAAKGNGYINAFWSKPITDEWPPEIDFVEVLGKPPTKDAHFTVHWSDNGHQQQGTATHTKTDLSEDFHVYGCEWGNDLFKWFMDGKEAYNTSKGHGIITGYPSPFYLMLNVHVVSKNSSWWTGVPDENNIFPAYTKVDWVRVYEKDTSLSIHHLGPATGEHFTSGSNIELMAEVVNKNMIETDVKFYADDSLLAVVNTPPYSFLWQNVEEGRYNIFPSLYDEHGRTVLSEGAYITVGDISNNLVFNGGFEKGKRNWQFILSNEANATFSISQDNDALAGNGSALFSIVKPGSDISDVQLKQKMYLEKDKTYQLSFVGKSSVETTSEVKIKIQEEQYIKYSKEFHLTNEHQNFKFIYKNKVDDHTASIHLELGKTIANILIDSVVFKEYDPTGITGYSKPMISSMAGNMMNIELPDPEEKIDLISVFNISGKMILLRNIKSEWNNKTSINIGDLQDGIYIVKILTNKNQYNQKILKN